MPYNVEYGLNDEEQDSDGRIITAEYTKYYVVCVYVPNAGRNLVRLDKRMRWDTLFQQHIVNLNKKKPVFICGDMNVSHNEIGKNILYNTFLSPILCSHSIEKMFFFRFSKSKNK